ncbi:ATP-dependent zinc protease family protein [Nitrincola tapanii]|uniref:ATP-dependent zinc protease n=1 Tax=Nitrincola tapanii TaxID=1708751 RepID=A0A5A9W5E9_9GAMM|nr:ATP-dependent zinc protease [Nitrincola tapanii]KAA0875674.1 ATP-dependent zinc protease [Nitrincola tapanii]
MSDSSQTPSLVGWREWIALPDLGVAALKCKVDTGARTSALHAFSVKEFKRAGQRWVKFGLHPHQGSDEEVWCEALVKDVRQVRDSGGHTTRRYFIETHVVIGKMQYLIELSLTRRDNMRFRMLLGREALKGRFYVDPARSYLMGKDLAP